jgi:hypothetical protein
MNGSFLKPTLGLLNFFWDGRVDCLAASFFVKADCGRAEKNAFHVFLSSPEDRKGSESRHLLAFSART